jgi:hypothetical protein
VLQGSVRIGRYLEQRSITIQPGGFAEMNIKTVRKYFRDEVTRNKASAVLFEEMLRHAFGAEIVVIVGHHLTIEDSSGTARENVLTENEIPSADTFMFDHEIMTARFGDDAIMVMQSLASTRTDDRDALLAEHWRMYGLPNRKPAPSKAAQEFNKWVDAQSAGNPATDPALW